MKLSENSLHLLKTRYLLRDSNFNIVEEPKELMKRVSSLCDNSKIENLSQTIYKHLTNLDFLPNSPTLMNAGAKNSNLSACFVLPVHDSMESIFTTVKNTALIHQTGGGTGFNFSEIRPGGSLVKTTQGVASGPISFMKVFDVATDTIKQGGKRRGANMGILNVSHPDIINFINSKKNGELKNFNISVLVTDDFMEAVKNDQPWNLTFNDKIIKTLPAKELFSLITTNAWESGDPGILFYDEINRNRDKSLPPLQSTNPCWSGDTKIYTTHGLIPIKKLVGNEIDVITTDYQDRFVIRRMRNIRKTAVNVPTYKIQLSNHNGKISELRGTPSHELVLENGIDIQLKHLMHNALIKGARKDKTTKSNTQDFYPKDLAHSSHKVLSVVESAPEDVYNGTVDEFHRYFVACGKNDFILSKNCGEQPLLPHESCNLASINLNNMLSSENKPTFNFDKLKETTINLVHFLNCVLDNSHFPIPEIQESTLKTRKIGIGIMGLADIFTKLEYVYGNSDSLTLSEKIMETINTTAHETSIQYDYKNQNLTTIAPTGSISIIANVSSGVEPHFAIVYKRNLKETMGKDFFDVNPTFLKISKEQGFYSENLIEKIFNNNGSLKNIPEVPEKIKSLFLTAHEIPFHVHVKMQSTFQKFTDSAVSKTINLSENATSKDVEDIYMLAYELKCKGITIFRNNCKGAENQVLTTSSDSIHSPLPSNPRERQKDHIAIFREIKTGCGTLYCGITFDEYGLLEVFPINSGTGGCSASQEAIGRSCSLMLKNNLAPKLIIKQYSRVKCNSCILKENVHIKSCSDGISILMRDYCNNPEILPQLISLQKQLNTPSSSSTFRMYTHSTSSIIPSVTSNKPICSNCGSTNLLGDKCKTCRDCGASSC